MIIEFNSAIDFETACQSIGLVGVAIYVTGYFLLCMGKVGSRGPRYFLLNLLAASCVLTSLWAEFNLSAALIQASYIVLSFSAVMVRVLRARPETLGHTA